MVTANNDVRVLIQSVSVSPCVFSFSVSASVCLCLPPSLSLSTSLSLPLCSISPGVAHEQWPRAASSAQFPGCGAHPTRRREPLLPHIRVEAVPVLGAVCGASVQGGAEGGAGGAGGTVAEEEAARAHVVALMRRWGRRGEGWRRRGRRGEGMGAGEKGR